MQHSSAALSIAIVTLLAGGSGQTGTVYSVRSEKGSGTVWMVGDEARLEWTPEEGAAGSSRVSIWKAGGKQHLILNMKDRTYFDAVAYSSAKEVASLSLATLNVREPFVVADVSKMRVDLLPSPQREGPSSGGAADCRPVSLKLSYDLTIRLADASIPGHVEGSGEYCLVDSQPILRLPFGHGLEIVAGIPKVDAVLAERLASLRGIPIRHTLTVTRQIEGGESVSATSTLALSEFRTTDMPPDRFVVPRDYRYQEPVISGPTRQEP